MEKYILITADCGDADRVIEQTLITEEEVTMMKSIVRKMPTNHFNIIKYKTGDMGDDNQKGSDYNHITNEEKDFLDAFLPMGGVNTDLSGINSIDSIQIIQIIETIL